MDTRSARIRARIIVLLGLLGLAATFAVAVPASANTEHAAAPATHSLAAAPSTTASHSVRADQATWCDLHFHSGGVVSTDLIRSGNTISVFTRNTSVPRRVYFDSNKIVGLAQRAWYGVTGSIGYDSAALPWNAVGAGAYAVFPVYVIAMHDSRGNKASTNCIIR